MTWNMAYWTPAGYKTVPNRRRQWAFIAAVAPDIALLQECRPDDVVVNGPAWLAEEYDIIGTIPERWQACSAVLARKHLRAAALDRSAIGEAEARWLDYLAGYVAAATVEIEGGLVSVASVHAVARPVEDPRVTDEEHSLIRREGVERAWHNDLAVAALSPWVAHGPFIVGGDWNTAELFDVNYPQGAEGAPGAGAQFFARRKAAGWHHALRKFHAEEIRTYLKTSSDAYELDHIFTDVELHAGLQRCEVADESVLVELSDHAPVIAHFDLASAAPAT